MPISARILPAASAPERTQSGTPMPLIAVAGERETGEFLAERFDALQAFEVADGILRHGRLPFVDAGEQRLGIEGDDLAQFVANDLENLIFGRVEDLLVARAAEKAADDGAIFRSAVRKLVVNESGGEHAVAGAARNQKSEAGRKRAAHFFVVAERDRDRRAVVDLAKFAGRFSSADCKHGGGGMGGRRR